MGTTTTNLNLYKPTPNTEKNWGEEVNASLDIIDSALASTFIVKTPSSTLPNEFALSELATGLLKNITSTGIPTIAVPNIDYLIPGDILSSGLTMSTAKLLGRTTALSGAIEEITINSTNLSLNAGVLNTIQNIATSSSPTFSGLTLSNSLILPYGSGVAINTLGQLAFDTNDMQLLTYDGSAVKVLSLPKKTFTFTLESPTASDVFPIIQFPYAVTLTKVIGTIYGGTSLTFNIDERTATELNSSGINTLTSSLTATTTGASSTTFSNAAIAANAFLVLVTSGISGTVGKIILEIEYTVDRT